MTKVKIIFFFIITGIVLSGVSSCNFQKEDEEQITSGKEHEKYFSYDLQNPDSVYHLPTNLKEISGISYYKKNKIACIQDENATIYIFDTKNGKVTTKIDFGKSGDYEDIAVAGDVAYVLRSDGTIFKLENFEKQKKMKTKKIHTSLTKKNDTEGLLYDKSTNSLLITCKRTSSINEKETYIGYNAIYRFDLNSSKLIEKPEFLIDLSITDSIRERGRIEKLSIKIAKKLKLLREDNSFHPSGIAVHPIDNNVYIISSVEKLLIIMNKKGNIKHIFELDNRLFSQPEGICFSENGDLFISNEGKTGRGNILKFVLTTDLEK